MKKTFLFLALSFFTVSFALPIQDHRLDPAALTRLAAAMGMQEGEDLVEYTQQNWLRKPGQERWELSELMPEQRLFVLNWAQEQELFLDWSPDCTCTVYHKAVIFGGTTSRMQKRLNYLKLLWNQGTHFDEIVWLTGERPLDPRVDSLTDRCKTEAEAAHVLWEEADLPDTMQRLPAVFVSTPMKGSIRPSTEDTLRAWLATDPPPCKVLFISNQPFCGYQFSIVKTHLPETFFFDVVGEGIADLTNDHPAIAAMTLDSIARWVYQENK